MNDQMNHGKGFLKEKLGGYQVDPPASVWSSISAGLGGRNRKGMIIISLAAAAREMMIIPFLFRQLFRSGCSPGSGDG